MSESGLYVSYAHVAPSGRNPFCVMAVDGAAKYSVRVLDVESRFGGQ